MALLCYFQPARKDHHAGMTSSSGCKNTNLAVIMHVHISRSEQLQCPKAIVAALTGCARHKDGHVAAGSRAHLKSKFLSMAFVIC